MRLAAALGVFVAGALAACAGPREPVVPAGPPDLHPSWTSCATELLGAPATLKPDGTGAPGQMPPPYLAGAEPLGLPRLPADWEPASAVVCGQMVRLQPDGSELMMLEEGRTTDIGNLVKALRLPDQPLTAGACTADLPGVAWFALLGADGAWLRPGTPGDACGKIRIEVRDALQALTLETVAATTLATVVSAEAAKTGCGEGYADMVAVETAMGRPRTDGTVEVPAAQHEMRLCIYRVPASEQGSGKPAGQFERGRLLPATRWADLRTALPKPAAVPACGAHAGQFAMLEPVDRVGTSVFVELDGCRRVLFVPSAGGPTTLAQADPRLLDLIQKS